MLGFRAGLVRPYLLAPFALALIIACGGGDDGGSEPIAAPTQPVDSEAASESESASSDSCAGTNLVYTNLETGTELTFTSTAALELVGRGGYSAVATDFEPEFNLNSARIVPEVPADGNMVVISITPFNVEGTPPPVEAGTEIAWTSDDGVLTFRVQQTSGEDFFGQSTGAEGTLMIKAVGKRLCFTVEYRDLQKELSGTYEAEVLNAQ